jgi:PPOX class probable F420-dependent enzyme
MEGSKLTLSTVGPDGGPHVTAMWYVLEDGEPWIFTHGKSQKVRNLERDPRATLLVEQGDNYERLRGAMLVCRAEIHRESRHRRCARRGGSSAATRVDSMRIRSSMIGRVAPSRHACPSGWLSASSSSGRSAGTTPSSVERTDHHSPGVCDG